MKRAAWMPGVWLIALIAGGCDNKSAPSSSAASTSSQTPPATTTASAASAPSSSAAAPSNADEIVFTKADWAIGTTRTVEYETVSKDTLPNAKRTSTSRWVAKEEILAAEAKTITKLKTSYIESTSIGTIGTQEVKDPPVRPVGKTFFVELKDKKLILNDDANHAVPPSALFLDTIIRDYAFTVGKPDPVLVGAPEGPLKIGATAFEDTLRAYLNGWYSGDSNFPKAALSNVSAKLKAVKIEGGAKLGVFDVTAKVVTQVPPVVYDFSGTMTVRADSRLVDLDLKGPSAFNGMKKDWDSTTHHLQVRY